MESSPTPEKLAGLRQALARDRKVQFKNGATVTRTNEGGVKVRTKGGIECAFGGSQLEAAYRYALHGPERQPEVRPQPKGDPAEYGDDVPF